MTQNTLIYIAMTNRTVVIMDTNDGIWLTKTKTAEKVDSIKLLVKDIGGLQKLQGKSTKGATDNKNDERKVSSIQAEHVTNILKSYYYDEKDKKNLAIVQFSHTDFVQSNAEVAESNMQLVHDMAAAIVLTTPTALDVYNFEPTDLAELQADIASLKEAVPTQTVMKTENKTITAEIKTKMGQLREVMNSLDTNVNTYKKKHSSFVSDYTFGRRMVQTGGGHLTEVLALMPEQHEALLGQKYTLGDTLTIKNHSDFTVEFGFTNNPAILPTVRQSVEGNTEFKALITKDTEGSFGHWLVVLNPNEFDDVNVTVFVAKG